MGIFPVCRVFFSVQTSSWMGQTCMQWIVGNVAWIVAFWGFVLPDSCHLRISMFSSTCLSLQIILHLIIFTLKVWELIWWTHKINERQNLIPAPSFKCLGSNQTSDPQSSGLREEVRHGAFTQETAVRGSLEAKCHRFSTNYRTLLSFYAKTYMNLGWRAFAQIFNYFWSNGELATSQITSLSRFQSAPKSSGSTKKTTQTRSTRKSLNQEA